MIQIKNIVCGLLLVVFSVNTAPSLEYFKNMYRRFFGSQQPAQNSTPTISTIPALPEQSLASLEFWHNGQQIAVLPRALAEAISPVFNNQLKQDVLVKDRYKIDVDDFDSETVVLFTALATAFNAAKIFEETKTVDAALIKKIFDNVTAAKQEYLVDLYGFLQKYDIFRGLVA